MSAPACETADVLVVGAGPVGLTLGSALAANGVQPRIIDRAEQWSPLSKAMTLTPRTLECFRMIDVDGQCLERGILSRRITHYTQCGNVFASADLAQLDGDYPGLLHLSQSDTTAILDRAVGEQGIEVERGWALTDVETDENGHLAHLRAEDGRTRRLRARFVVGADGSRSRVRELVDTLFDGAEQDETFIMADIAMQGFPHSPHDRHQFWLDEGTFFTVLPIDGRNFRLISTCRVSTEDADEAFILRRFQELLDAVGLHEVVLADPYWITRFNPRQFVSDRFRRDGILLAGDAAHIQSPIGAQGLNTGIQDAVNLAWKLGLVVQDKASVALLDSYHGERYQVAQALFAYNDLLSERVFGCDEPARRALRDQNRQLAQPDFHAAEIAKISQFAVSYDEPADPVRRGGIAAGRRFPALSLRSAEGSFDLLRELGAARHIALAIVGESRSLRPDVGTALRSCAARLGADAFRFFAVYDRVSPRQRFGCPPGRDVLFDVAGRERERLGLRDGDVVVIRPDGYVARIADPGSLASVGAYFDRILR